MTDVSPKEFNGSGTTLVPDTYTDIIFDVRTRRDLNILLKNTGGANGLTYRVDVYANFNGTLAKEQVAAANLAFGTIIPIPISVKYAKVVLQVKSQVPGNVTTYVYEAIAAVF
jgi:hypothetical protein